MIESIFGKVIKSLRIRLDISQETLSELSNLDRTFVSKLERGESQPTLVTIFSLSKALKIKPSVLVKMVEQEYEEHI